MSLHYLLFVASVVLFCRSSAAQTYQLTPLSDLSETTRESSGLLFRDGRLITHNDSGDGPLLYEIDTLDGGVLREVFVANATHVDWEDIAADADYLYIGDIGNNFGSRTDLRVYRLPWADYWSGDTVTADVIEFAYADQTDFTDNQFFTPYDAEALLAGEDSLYIFTKDWSAPRTRVYALPKVPGAYAAAVIDSLTVPVLITGVDAAPAGDRLLFVGYSGVEAVVLTLSDFAPPFFSQGNLNSWSPPLEASFKTEAIAWRDDRFAFLSTETLGGHPAALYRLDTDFVDVAPEAAAAPPVSVFPRPARDRLSVTGREVLGLTLYALDGTRVRYARGSEMPLYGIASGTYVLLIATAKGRFAEKVTVIGF